jgi:nucleoside-diphosphate-sugar epimerase
MKVFLTGATGYIGSAVAEELMAAGHTVAGLARSDEAVERLEENGVTPVRGDLKEPAGLTGPIAAADGVIHAGTTNDAGLDLAVVAAMLEALAPGKAFVYTSGTWVLGNTGDQPADETAAINPTPLVAWRPALEQATLAAANKGLRATVIRPAMVYGRGGGLMATFVQTATEQGAARYIGSGENRWALVHVEDLANLYLRVLESAEAGSLWHAADGPSVLVKDIAEAASFAADAGGRTESWPVEEARAQLGAFADALLLDQVISADKARQTLGWTPRGMPVLDELRYGSYATARINP